MPSPAAPLVTYGTDAAFPAASGDGAAHGVPVLASSARPAYRVRRLMEPEPPRRRGWRNAWVAGVVTLAIGAAVAVGGVPALSEGPVAPEAPAGAAAAAGAPRVVPTGEWLRIVGAGSADSAAAPAPLSVGWGVLAPDAAERHAFWTPPRLDAWRGGATTPMAWLLGGVVSASQAALIAAGGEVRVAAAALATPWPWAGADAGGVTVTLPPALLGSLHDHGDAAWVDGINYADPVGARLPLLRTGGYEYHRVSPHFTVADFATHDGAPYARIAPDLVAALEALRAVVGPLTVISGYRHPHYNALPSVGGASMSRHQAGQAADVWAEGVSSLEIAASAVEALGCRIGLGLGRNTVHVDVRGYLSTWTYPGAPVGRAVFDRWVRGLCGSEGAVAPPMLERVYEEEWMAHLVETGTDTDETIHLEPTLAAPAATDAVALPEATESVDARVRDGLAGFARASFERTGPGVVVVDLMDGARPATDDELLGRAHYAGALTPEVARLNVGPLLRYAAAQPEGSVFVYVVRHPGGRLAPGVAPTAPEAERPALPASTLPAAPAAPAAPAPGPTTTAAARAGWFVVLPSDGTLSDAEAALALYRGPLRTVGLGPVLHAEHEAGETRYRVVVGPYLNAAAAEAARQQARGRVPVTTRVASLAL